MKSYTSEKNGVLAFLKEGKNLYSSYRSDLPGRVQRALEDGRRVEERIRGTFGVQLSGLDMLEVGPGQFLAQMTYFAARNRVVGIDLDLIVQGFKPLGYAKMLRVNGLRRTAKTVARKIVGVDRRFARNLARELQLSDKPQLAVHQMDVCDMSFADNSFDSVYCRSVFHHLPDPSVAIRQMARVMRPGAVAYISIHLYTSETGSLDPRVFTARRRELPYWAHLRPRHRETLQANAFLNRLRLPQWREIFEAGWPGATILTIGREDPELEAKAIQLQREGELLDYSMEELLTFEVVALWQKPLN